MSKSIFLKAQKHLEENGQASAHFSRNELGMFSYDVSTKCFV